MFTVKVSDDENPTITCPSDYDVQDQDSTPGITGYNLDDDIVDASHDDNCANSNSITVVSPQPSSAASLNEGDNTITMRIEDANGNSNTCTYTITVLGFGACCHSGTCERMSEADCALRPGSSYDDQNTCPGACGSSSTRFFFCFGCSTIVDTSLTVCYTIIGACCKLDSPCVDNVLASEASVVCGAPSSTNVFLTDGNCAANCHFEPAADVQVDGGTPTPTVTPRPGVRPTIWFAIENTGTDPMIDLGLTFQLIDGSEFLQYDERTTTHGTFLPDVVGNGPPAVDGDVYVVFIDSLAPGTVVNVTFTYELDASASGTLHIEYEGSAEGFTAGNNRKRQVTPPTGVIINLDPHTGIRVDVSVVTFSSDISNHGRQRIRRCLRARIRSRSTINWSTRFACSPKVNRLPATSRSSRRCSCRRNTSRSTASTRTSSKTPVR
jgi:hypothetical protein